MKALIFFLLLFISSFVKAQTAKEIFKQKQTQKEYLIQQLAALKIYAGYLKQGYDIVNKGVNTIKGFTKGEFDLHKIFFNSLKMVNPDILDEEKFAEVISWQIVIKRNFRFLASSNNFTQSDRAYFEDVQSNILKECEYNLDELILVISSGKLEMKDDERIRRLEILYQSMKEKYQFSQIFIQQAKSLSALREQEEKNKEASKKLHGITN